MEHALDLNEITLLTVIALACGFALIRLRQPAVVGYILAGVVLGPSGLGLVSDSGGIELFAELGVLLLLFLIGMELNLRAFKSVYRVALLCAGLQSAVAIGLTFATAWLLDWSFGQAIVLGFVLSLSSTAVGIKILEEIGELKTDTGRLTIGVLIAQDLLIVPMLLLIQSLGASGSEAGFDWWAIAKLGAGVGVLAGVAVILTQRGRVVLPWSGYLKGQRDVAPLAAIGFCFAAAAISGYIGLTPSYGAFLAGLIMGASTDRRAAMHVTRPVQSLLLMVFFLSIGLLIDLTFVLANLWTILFLVFVVLIAKTISNILILNSLGEPWKRAFLAGVVMSQVGEFSFVLAAAGLSVGLLAADGYQLALSVIALSLILSPFWLLTARRFHDLGQQRFDGLSHTFESLYPQVFEKGRTITRKIVEETAALKRHNKPTMDQTSDNEGGNPDGPAKDQPDAQPACEKTRSAIAAAHPAQAASDRPGGSPPPD